MILTIDRYFLDTKRLTSIFDPKISECLTLERNFFNILSSQKFKYKNCSIGWSNVYQIIFCANASKYLVLECFWHSFVVDVSLFEVSWNCDKSLMPFAQTGNNYFIICVWPQPFIVELLQVGNHQRILACVTDIGKSWVVWQTLENTGLCDRHLGN